eukprot:scaffold14060_cov133-Isochrysis_galbana.AAC.3
MHRLRAIHRIGSLTALSLECTENQAQHTGLLPGAQLWLFGRVWMTWLAPRSATTRGRTTA